MTVKELIQELEKLESQKVVKIWSAGTDDGTEEIVVSDRKNAVWILDFEVTW